MYIAEEKMAGEAVGEKEVAIIIPCRNEGIYLRQTLEFLMLTEARDKADIIIIDDNSVDNSCSFLRNNRNKYPNVSLIKTMGRGASQARNLGAELAGKAEVLVFCDAHILIGQGWLNSLMSAFENKEVSVVCPGIGNFDPKSPTGYGQSFNKNFEVIWLKKPEDLEEVPLAPGACMAVRKKVFDAVGGFDRGFLSWGFEDVELSIKLWLFGYKIYIHPGVRIGHKFRKIQPYPVNLIEFHYNKLRMAFSHFNIYRIHKILNMMEAYSIYDEVVEKLINSDTSEQSIKYRKLRLHDDDWYFDRFGIPF